MVCVEILDNYILLILSNFIQFSKNAVSANPVLLPITRSSITDMKLVDDETFLLILNEYQAIKIKISAEQDVESIFKLLKDFMNQTDSNSSTIGIHSK